MFSQSTSTPVDDVDSHAISPDDFMDDPKNGVKVSKRTFLAPVFMLKSIPERGWMKGQIVGVMPDVAGLLIKGDAAVQGDQVFGDLFKKPAAPAPTKAAAVVK